LLPLRTTGTAFFLLYPLPGGGDCLVFTASVFWPFPLLLVGCCPFLSQFSSPSLSLTMFGILIIKNVMSESCGYNLLNAVHRHERTVYILEEISGRVTSEFQLSSGRASAGVPYIGRPPVLYFPRFCPTSAGARPVSVKKPRPLVVSMHGTPADTRPCTGRR